MHNGLHQHISTIGTNKSKTPGPSGDKLIGQVALESKLSPWEPQDPSRPIGKGAGCTNKSML